MGTRRMSTGKKPVGCRWIYTVKYKADGSIERFKARLVAKGCKLDWPLQQFDVKMSFCMASYLKKYIWIFHQDAWFTKSMRAFGYRQSNSDHTLFLKKQHGKIQRLVEINVLSSYKTRSYALSVVSQYMHNLEKQHMNAVMHFERSTSGYFTFVYGNLVTWKSKKRMSSLVQVQKRNLGHVEVDKFFIKEKLDDKIVELPKFDQDQLVDILTKAVVSSRVF
ncbi:hypothetical protein CK203_007848 [Vitis vinifera]|uniref:Reverse transcriptase Ty1/copia-type domain-containing protein n=1 Tax=Vitis vinifera TaxID=29760 RepID=A0A438K1F8_VITVI|nr:hypothetical protein CK203_007848 [Vitis vinifera]